MGHCWGSRKAYNWGCQKELQMALLMVAQKASKKVNWTVQPMADLMALVMEFWMGLLMVLLRACPTERRMG